MLLKKNHSLTCASILKQHRYQLAYQLLESFKITERGAKELAEQGHDLDTFVKRNIYVLLDYLYIYFTTHDETYKHLYIGEKLKHLHYPNLTLKQSTELKNKVLTKDRDIFSDFLNNKVTKPVLELFLQQIEQIHDVILKETKEKINILFVGDCLYLDVISFLVSQVLTQNIAIISNFATSKNHQTLQNELKEMTTQKFDLIFFSPFTYDFSIEYLQLSQWRNCLMGQPQIQQICEHVIQKTETIIDLLADLFDCPIWIHNSVHLVREDSSMKRWLKNKLTSRIRSQSKMLINNWLPQYLNNKNTLTFKHLYLIDETKCLRQTSEHRLGAYFYRSNLQHPAVFGKVIAEIYFEIIYTYSRLMRKKLIVCDLDNTLWEGIIGEGSVRHYHERQDILKRLKEKGIVLAINSKNDPDNVKWDNGTLNENDFVYANINWEPKVKGMQLISQVLNLKTSSFVFVDDRIDERELVNQVFPEILCLDATKLKTWGLLDLWSDILDDHPEMDRTLMYSEREERKQFLQSENPELDQNELFQSLNLALTIREAKNSDLKRAEELINRTNQFNLCGSRTTYQEVKQWSKSNNFRILLGETSDRFGSMGTICVIILKLTENQIEIPIYVLSCRVFGYGIEKAMLNYIKRLVLKTNKRIIGFYQETGQNQPCKNLYRDNGFLYTGEYWCHEGIPVIEEPTWLNIKEL